MNLKEGVVPVTQLKNHTKEVLAMVAKTGESVLVTQNGHSAVVIMDVGAYQAQQKKLQILEQIAKGEREILQGKGISHAEALKRIKSWRV